MKTVEEENQANVVEGGDYEGIASSADFHGYAAEGVMKIRPRSKLKLMGA